MNISLTEHGKKMSFKEFADMFGKHFKSNQEMELKYTELTGRKVEYTGTKLKKSKRI
jgi:hypothetical protein